MVYEIDALEVGDVVFYKGEQVTFLIERKTLSDYASSIVDKRGKN